MIIKSILEGALLFTETASFILRDLLQDDGLEPEQPTAPKQKQSKIKSKKQNKELARLLRGKDGELVKMIVESGTTNTKSIIQHVKKCHMFVEQDGNCNYCHQFFKYHALTIDHIQPRSKGGTNCKDNLQLLCRKCNQVKWNFIVKSVSLLDETHMMILYEPNEEIRDHLDPMVQCISLFESDVTTAIFNIGTSWEIPVNDAGRVLHDFSVEDIRDKIEFNNSTSVQIAS